MDALATAMNCSLTPLPYYLKPNLIQDFVGTRKNSVISSAFEALQFLRLLKHSTRPWTDPIKTTKKTTYNEESILIWYLYF